MPSNTGRLGIGLGPPLAEAWGFGSSGAICDHWVSVSSELWRDMAGLLVKKIEDRKKEKT